MMMGYVSREVLYEGLKFYAKQFLFNRSRSKYLRIFVEKRGGKRGIEKSLEVELVYSIPLRSYIYLHSSKSYIYSGLYEYNVVKYLKRRARRYRPCLFIDVGAYVGYYSILMAKEGCDVLAFEPDPRNFVLLSNNIAMNKLENKVKTFNIAICNKDKSQVLFKLSKSPSESTFAKYLREELIQSVISIPCTALDSLIQNLKPLSDKMIIKIDVEGAALHVLRGSMSVITEFRPYIVLEIHRTFDKDDELMALGMLRRHEYEYKVLEWRNSKNYIIALEPKPR